MFEDQALPLNTFGIFVSVFIVMALSTYMNLLSKYKKEKLSPVGTMGWRAILTVIASIIFFFLTVIISPRFKNIFSDEYKYWTMIAAVIIIGALLGHLLAKQIFKATYYTENFMMEDN